MHPNPVLVIGRFLRTVCFDEIPYQLISETQKPLPLQAGKPLRYDYEYRREGVCNLFMFLEPLAG